MSTPQHAVIKHVLDNIVKRVLAREMPAKHQDPYLFWTGPAAFGEFYNEYLGRKVGSDFVFDQIGATTVLLDFKVDGIIAHREKELFNRKYKHWEHDRTTSPHYTALVRQGKIFKSN
jgi:hypothetical protein